MKLTHNNNNMLMHGFILLTILATAKSAEAEITMEAAFQGHCGHTSPCEQLCYEIHDGMYECDCIEGYELNKNGYSCQVINSTAQSKSDEDVLYQKGASFSAKLAGNDKYSSLAGGATSSASAAGSSASYEIENDNLNMSEDDITNFFVDDTFTQQQQHQEQQLQNSKSSDSTNSEDDKVNLNDYYISAESINLNNDSERDFDMNDGDFINSNRNSKSNNNSPDVPDFMESSKSRTKLNQSPTVLATTTPSQFMTTVQTRRTTVGTTNAITMPSDLVQVENYYIKPDMSVYDDVNNNQLNLRPLNRNQYQIQRTIISEAQIQSKNNNFKNNKNRHQDILYAAANGTDMKLTKNNGIGDCVLNCGIDGVCDNSNGEAKCICAFGKTGPQCAEDMLLRVPKFSHKSWLAFAALRGAYKHLQLHIEFRPEAFDGVLLLSGERDDLTGDFLALLLNKGFVEFWFDCGSGVGSVRSLETIRLNEWNTVVIYRHRWDAWLILNHGTKVQGRSNGLFSRITFREPVFLGGLGNITGLLKRLPVNTGFVGCIRRFIANDHAYNFAEHPTGDVLQGFNIQECITDKCFKYPCQHGGKCLPTDQGAVCLCPMGFVGDLCEIRMDLQIPAFNGSSFLRHGPIEDTALIWLELKVILKPEKSDGLILYSGPKTHGDFIGLTLNQGFVEFHFDLGSGPAVVRSASPLALGEWHTIKVSRTARLAVLKIDQLPEEMTISPNGFWHLSLPESLFLGGVNHVDRLHSVLKGKPFFVGCIQMVDINGHTLSIISEALGGTNIDNCPHTCLARPCGSNAECIPQLESYECRCRNGHAGCKLLETDAHNKINRKYKGNKHDIYEHKIHKLSKIHKTKAQTHNVHTTTQPPTVTLSHATTKNNFFLEQGEYQDVQEKYSSPYKIKSHKSQMQKRKHHKDIKNINNRQEHPLPYLPAHYASFQPEGNVLTFGDNVHIDMHRQADTEDSAPFVIDETIFAGDDLTEDYQRKQLAQDMRRIMANTPLRKQTKMPVYYEDETEAKHQIDMEEAKQEENHQLNIEDIEKVHAETLEKSSGAPQTHTDWSVLKQLDLAADYQSHIGVRKNFGACFAGTNSYFHYNDAETIKHISSNNIDLNLRIKTHSTNGVLLWSGRQRKPHTSSSSINGYDEDEADFLALGIEDGYLHFRYNLGLEETNILFNATKVSDGLWHRVRAIRDAQTSYLEVDGRKSAVQHTPSKLRLLNTNTGLYVGGLPETAYFTQQKYNSGIVGCISEIVLAGELKLNFDANTLGTAHNVETGIL